MLRNIEANSNIEPIVSKSIGPLPKAYAYADDINGTIKHNETSVQALFEEYERLTKASGLELNADKTEIMRIHKSELKQDSKVDTINVTYLNKKYELKLQKRIKINGIFLQQSMEKIIDENVQTVAEKVDKNLRRWSARNFTTLGRILIVKTFGISQIIFLMQSLALDVKHFKLFNHYLYKFIWNRHYSSAKAPERVKREIVNTPVKLGGYGMLDIIELDQSIKVKSIARLMETNHPFLSKIRQLINFNEFLDVKSKNNCEPVSELGIKLLSRLRQLKILHDLDESSLAISTIKQTKISTIINKNGLLSLQFFKLKLEGKSKIMDITMEDFEKLTAFVENDKIASLRLAISSRYNSVQSNEKLKYSIINKGKIVDLRTISSQKIREVFKDNTPICVYKLGSIMTASEALNWTNALRKVTSVRHRNTLLKMAHGDIYSNEKLARFGLINTPECSKCGELEDFQHKIFKCPYAAKLWGETFALTDTLKNSPLAVNEDIIENKILGASIDTNPMILSIHAEVASRLLYNNKESSLPVNPRVIIRQAIDYVMRGERKLGIKNSLDQLKQLLLR